MQSYSCIWLRGCSVILTGFCLKSKESWEKWEWSPLPSNKELAVVVDKYLISRPTDSSGPRSRTVLTWRRGARLQLLGKDGSHWLLPAPRDLNSLPWPGQVRWTIRASSIMTVLMSGLPRLVTQWTKGASSTVYAGAARRLAILHRRPSY